MTEISPPFLPLEEHGGGNGGSTTTRNSISMKDGTTVVSTTDNNNNPVVVVPKSTSRAKSIVYGFAGLLVGLLVWDIFITPPERRWIHTNAIDRFFVWVQDHPQLGMLAFVIVICLAVIFMLPVGHILPMGCGFVYKDAYGWVWGMLISVNLAMMGAFVGSILCFLLGRYFMRDYVRSWIRNYPLFKAIDMAAAEHGIKILAMLFLTPLAPLGPLSYVCGTTSMTLSNFALSRVASFPLTLFYVYVGASAGALIHSSGSENGENGGGSGNPINDNPYLIVVTIVISIVVLYYVTVSIKRELKTILEGLDTNNDCESGAPEEATTLLEQVETSLLLAPGGDKLD